MLNLTAQNRKIQLFLEENGIKAIPKYLEKGSQKGCIRIWTKYETWNGNEELQNKYKELGFKDFDGRELHQYSSNGGAGYCIFVRVGTKELHDKLFN